MQKHSIFALFFLIFLSGGNMFAQIPELQKASEKGRTQFYGKEELNKVQVEVLYPDSAHYQKNSYKLIDGKKSKAIANSVAWFRCSADSLVLAFNFDGKKRIDTLEISTFLNIENLIYPPDSLLIEFEKNGKINSERFLISDLGPFNLAFSHSCFFVLPKGTEVSKLKLTFFNASINQLKTEFLVDEIRFR